MPIPLRAQSLSLTQAGLFLKSIGENLESSRLTIINTFEELRGTREHIHRQTYLLCQCKEKGDGRGRGRDMQGQV